MSVCAVYTPSITPFYKYGYAKQIASTFRKTLPLTTVRREDKVWFRLLGNRFGYRTGVSCHTSTRNYIPEKTLCSAHNVIHPVSFWGSLRLC